MASATEDGIGWKTTGVGSGCGLGLLSAALDRSALALRARLVRRSSASRVLLRPCCDVGNAKTALPWLPSLAIYIYDTSRPSCLLPTRAIILCPPPLQFPLCLCPGVIRHYSQSVLTVAYTAPLQARIA